MAVTVRLLVTVTAQVALAVAQAPFQLANVLFGAGAAVKVTTVPEVTVRVQVAPQLMPAGLDVTVPVPFAATVRVTDTGGGGGVEPLSLPAQAVNNAELMMTTNSMPDFIRVNPLMRRCRQLEPIRMMNPPLKDWLNEAKSCSISVSLRLWTAKNPHKLGGAH